LPGIPWPLLAISADNLQRRQAGSTEKVDRSGRQKRERKTRVLVSEIFTRSGKKNLM